MKRLFVTGCARSGTTLLNRLFHAFRDVEVISPETSIDDFCSIETAGSFLVAKRTPLTILSVPLPEKELERQFDIVRKQEIQIVNIIRDGRDVVHVNPTGPRVNVNRWVGCILQVYQFHQNIVLNIRYEDLARDPDAVQDELTDCLGLRPRAKFSEYPSFVPENVFDEPDFRDLPSYGRRPIDINSIGHCPSEYVDLRTSCEERSQFDRILTHLGYTEGETTAIGKSTLPAEEYTLFQKLSDNLDRGSVKPRPSARALGDQNTMTSS